MHYYIWLKQEQSLLLFFVCVRDFLFFLFVVAVVVFLIIHLQMPQLRKAAKGVGCM